MSLSKTLAQNCISSLGRIETPIRSVSEAEAMNKELLVWVVRYQPSEEELVRLFGWAHWRLTGHWLTIEVTELKRS
jgi:hypothetical protein